MPVINEITADELHKLFSSLDDLDLVIANAKKILIAKNASANLLDRMNSYCEILTKQRALANTLSEKLKTNETESITRITSIIVALSSMLMSDVTEVLSASRFNKTLDKTTNHCDKQTFSKEQIC